MFGKRLQKILDTRQMTGADLSRLCGLPKSLTYRYLSGKGENPTLETMEKIARGLGLPVNQIMIDQTDE